jgi:molybdopterin-dependent oxidoreductase alpha subunit
VSDGRGGAPSDSKPAGGLEAVVSTLTHARRETGLLRGARLLAQVNQTDGFDCPGCAWPDPAERGTIEFCENGAKAVAHEATRRRCDAGFFERHTLATLLEQSDQWLEQQGRLVTPLHRRPGADRYVPISWPEAFARLAFHLRRLDSPDRAIFYTSGRASNEAAFLYQLFVRCYGTNNLPDCSNLCHESSGTGLQEVIGVGKGTVDLEDFERADLVLVLGQNPGSNHPRMLTTLQRAARRGCRIVSINPLRERGLVSFAHPQELRGLLGGGTPIAELFVQVAVGGDVALLQAVVKAVLEREARSPGRILDTRFIGVHTRGFAAYREAIARASWEVLERESGVPRDQVERLADLYCASSRVIACWAMGLTQHRHGVANVQEIVNLLLLRGNLGRPGAGVCPVRGHSNVQGDRTMGIWERPSPAFLDRLGAEFRFEPPRRHGLDSVGAIEAMHAGHAEVFLALGGNFLVAAPDTTYTAEALRRCRLTAHVATKLNRSHLVCGEEALLLPCLGRTELDVQRAGPQFVTVEDSMSVVHRSQGRLQPASLDLRSEPAIVAGLARATLGAENSVPWEELVADYDRIRDHIARVVPGCEEMNRRVREPGGFRLPNSARERRFDGSGGTARFTVHALPERRLEPGRYWMMTLRSHDQFNTTVYGLDDRYRGIRGGRRVVFLNSDDLAREGLAADARVDLVSECDGVERVVRGFRVVPYDIPRGCAATYFPETNALVPVSTFAEKSRTPAYKSVAIHLRAARAPAGPEAR